MTKATQTVRTIVFVLVSISIVAIIFSMIFRVDFFNTGTSYYLEFDSIGIIMTGSPIRKAGVRVGSVIDVKINPKTQRTVLLLARLFQGNIIRTSDTISILTGGLLGDQFIDIAPGDPNAPQHPEWSTIQGKPSFDLASIAASGEDVLVEIGRVSTLIANLVERNDETVTNALINLENLTRDLSGMGRMAQTLEGEIGRMGSSLNAALAGIERAAQEIENAGKTLNRRGSILSLAGNPETADNIEAILQDLREITGNLNQITENIKTLLTE